MFDSNTAIHYEALDKKVCEPQLNRDYQDQNIFVQKINSDRSMDLKDLDDPY